MNDLWLANSTNSTNLFETYHHIACELAGEKKYTMAIPYFEKALKYKAHSAQLCECCHGAGVAYFRLEQNLPALVYFAVSAGYAGDDMERDSSESAIRNILKAHPEYQIIHDLVVAMLDSSWGRLQVLSVAGFALSHAKDLTLARGENTAPKTLGIGAEARVEYQTTKELHHEKN